MQWGFFMRGYMDAISQIELAWAAGLFDGEGSVSWHWEGKRRKTGLRGHYPKLYVGNTDRRLLDRFFTAVGLGKVRGPYGRFGREGQEIKPMYHWTATHKQGREAAILLRPYLSPAKLEKVNEAFPGRDIRE
jgi:hypothetical protein